MRIKSTLPFKSTAARLASSLFILFIIYTGLSIVKHDQHGWTLLSASAEVIVDEYEGVFLEINKSTNILHVYLNDHIMYTFPIATGKSKELTPTGTFLIVTKVKEPWYVPKQIAGGSPANPLGTRWMGLNVGDTSGYKYGIHGTNNPSSIGHHVSQGCIRMHNEDVEWLFRHIPLHTPVRIIDEQSEADAHSATYPRSTKEARAHDILGLDRASIQIMNKRSHPRKAAKKAASAVFSLPGSDWRHHSS